MSGRLLGVALAVMTGLCLAAIPAAFARSTVTVDGGPAAVLFRGSSAFQTVSVDTSDIQERSCEARRTKSRARISNRLGSVERKGAVVACEQPPRSSLNITGLKTAEASAITEAG